MKYLLLISIPVILSFLLLGGCSSGERVASDGDKVSVNYTGKLEDGTVFDTSIGKQPLSFTIGAGEMISGFDNAVRGMKVGETKTVTLSPDQAYGEYRDDLIITLERSKIPPSVTIDYGKKISLKNNLGQTFIAVIIDISPTTVTVDANHELASKTLIFEIELLSID
jgi:peptidylprolyl isomerase